MGLNYGFDILCHRDQLWPFVDSVMELAKPSKASTTITFGSQQKVIPQWLRDGCNTLSLNEPQQDDGFCLSIPFTLDEEIKRYLEEDLEYNRANYPDTAPLQHEYDELGRVFIGCVYFYICTDLNAIGRMGCDTDLIAFEFRAATTKMSRLFQCSESVRRTFLGLAKKHNAPYCLFATGGQGNATVLWLDGAESAVDIPDDWLPMSEVREIVKTASSS